ncbi:MAG: hypothetical protein HOQ24_13785 [Mycobacteriaceae bacterium]|nr:hypothetical protein [Mycobacteriaceae bacterium]
MDNDSGRGKPDNADDEWFPTIPTSTGPEGQPPASLFPPAGEPASFQQPGPAQPYRGEFAPPGPAQQPHNDFFNPQADPFGPTPAAPLKESGGMPWRVIFAVLGALVLIGGVVTAVVVGGRPSPAPNPSPAPVTDKPATSPKADVCANLSGNTQKDQPGGQDSPVNVVYALQYAYYVKRDAAAVTALYAPGVLDEPTKHAIADFIAKIPQRTKYCVTAAQVGPDTVNYDVNELQPGSTEPIRYSMFLTVSPVSPYTIVKLGARKP